MTQTLAQIKATGLAQAAVAIAQVLQPTPEILHLVDASDKTVLDLTGQRISTLVIGELPATLTVKIDSDNFDTQGANDFKLINTAIGVVSVITLQYVREGEVKDSIVLHVPIDALKSFSVSATNIPAAPSENQVDATPYLLCSALTRGV